MESSITSPGHPGATSGYNLSLLLLLLLVLPVSAIKCNSFSLQAQHPTPQGGHQLDPSDVGLLHRAQGLGQVCGDVLVRCSLNSSLVSDLESPYPAAISNNLQDDDDEDNKQDNLQDLDFVANGGLLCC